jgi:hypothetical protein
MPQCLPDRGYGATPKALKAHPQIHAGGLRFLLPGSRQKSPVSALSYIECPCTDDAIDLFGSKQAAKLEVLSWVRILRRRLKPDTCLRAGGVIGCGGYLDEGIILKKADLYAAF